MSVAGVDPAGGYKGHWTVEGQAMVWRHAGVLDRDVNALLDDFEGRFTLVESNGSKTLFQRVRALPSTRCPS